MTLLKFKIIKLSIFFFFVLLTTNVQTLVDLTDIWKIFSRGLIFEKIFNFKKRNCFTKLLAPKSKMSINEVLEEVFDSTKKEISLEKVFFHWVLFFLCFQYHFWVFFFFSFSAPVSFFYENFICKVKARDPEQKEFIQVKFKTTLLVFRNDFFSFFQRLSKKLLCRSKAWSKKNPNTWMY